MLIASATIALLAVFGVSGGADDRYGPDTVALLDALDSAVQSVVDDDETRERLKAIFEEGKGTLEERTKAVDRARSAAWQLDANYRVTAEEFEQAADGVHKAWREHLGALIDVRYQIIEQVTPEQWANTRVKFDEKLQKLAEQETKRQQKVDEQRKSED